MKENKNMREPAQKSFHTEQMLEVSKKKKSKPRFFNIGSEEQIGLEGSSVKENSDTELESVVFEEEIHKISFEITY